MVELDKAAPVRSRTGEWYRRAGLRRIPATAGHGVDTRSDGGQHFDQAVTGGPGINASKGHGSGHDVIHARNVAAKLKPVRDAVEAQSRLRFWFPTAVVAGLALPFYWLSAVPYVNGGDWGDFQVYGYLGGIAHSPTYPLLTSAIFVGTHTLGIVEPAHAANLVNATFGALAAVLLFSVARDVTGSAVAALAATIVYATGFRVWADAVQAEAFSLQALLVLGIAAALRAFQRRPTLLRFSGVALATGLSLTNHGLSLFVVPFTVAYLVARRSLRVPQPRDAAITAGAFVLGLTPWLYLLRARWTEVAIHNPATQRLLGFRDIWNEAVSSTASAGGTGLSAGVTGTWVLESRWNGLTTDLLREYGWIWLVVLGAGFFSIAARDWRLAGWTLGSAISIGCFAILYQIPDYAQYFAVIYALLGIWLAGGLALVLSGLRTVFGRMGWRRATRPAVVIVSIAILAGAGARAGIQMTGDAGRNVSEHWTHAETHYRHARSQIRHMVPNSVYMTNWTSSWYHQYALLVEGFGSEKNIEIRTTRYETMGIDQAEDILRGNRSLYLQRSTPQYEQQFTVVPEGAFFQVFASAKIRDGDLVKDDQDRVYLVEEGERRWVPTLEIFDAHGFAWDRVRVLEARDLRRLPEGPPLEMPERSDAGRSKPPCPPTCTTGT